MKLSYDYAEPSDTYSGAAILNITYDASEVGARDELSAFVLDFAKRHNAELVRQEDQDVLAFKRINHGREDKKTTHHG